MFSPESKIFLWINKNSFVEGLNQCWRLEVRRKARNVFCDEPTSVWPQSIKQHRIFIKFFFDFARFFLLFLLILHTSNFGTFRNLIKQLIHLCLLDMRLVTANKACSAELAIYHLISNVHSWNNNYSIVNYYYVKGKEWKIYSCGLAQLSEPQEWKILIIIWQTT